MPRKADNRSGKRARRSDPTDRLARDRCYVVEAAVIVQNRGVVVFGDSSRQQVNGCAVGPYRDCARQQRATRRCGQVGCQVTTIWRRRQDDDGFVTKQRYERRRQRCGAPPIDSTISIRPSASAIASNPPSGMCPSRTGTTEIINREVRTSGLAPVSRSATNARRLEACAVATPQQTPRKLES
jgi:hypothetical protein